MNHIFNRLPPRINFLYGSLCALRREHFEPFQESLSRKRFAPARGGQVGSVVAVPLAIASASLAPLVPAMLIPLGVFLAAHILLNARFHGFLLKKKGPWFAGRAVVFTLFDQLVMFCGIVGGAVHHVWNSVLRPGRAGRED